MIDYINKLFSNHYFQIFLTLFLGMFAGLTLRPIPKVLQTTISNCFIYKLIILILLGCRIFCPIDYDKLIAIITISFLLLLFLDILRYNF